MSGPDSPQLPHIHFIPDQVGFLVSYGTEVAGSLNTGALDILKAANRALADEKMRLLPESIQIIDFPAPPDGAVQRDETGALRSSPFALVFANVEGTYGNPIELVRLAHRLDTLVVTDPNADFKQEAVMLNWLNSAVGYPIGTGGPGVRPQPYRGDATRWQHTPPAFEPLPEVSGQGAGVEVVILDTAWPKEFLDQAYAAWEQAPVKHALVERLLGPAERLDIVSMTQEDERRLACIYIDGHSYVMRDHGLFVAGIVNTIAPQAKLTLVEVLNEYGIGDIITVGGALSAVAHRRSASGPMVVNCSLVMSLPFHELHKWHAEARQMVMEATGLGARDAQRWLLDQGLPFEYVCNLLEAQGRTVVAAAGNENRPEMAVPPPARYPAAFEKAHGVGAMGRLPSRPLDRDTNGNRRQALRGAAYSNKSDTPTTHGIVTLGGQPGEEQGILGIYLGKFPDEYLQCTSGWGWWSGTSFATPIVTGLLALELGELAAHGSADKSTRRAMEKLNGRQLSGKRVVQDRITDFDEDVIWIKQDI